MSITEEEALSLVLEFANLKSKYEESNLNKDKLNLINHENKMIKKLSYLVLNKTRSYKKFPNYEDLNQDGLEALVMGLKSFNKSKGSIFWWLHKYIDTRIHRSANAYSTVRIPLVVAKTNPPKIDQISPSMESKKDNQESSFIKNENKAKLKSYLKKLNNEDKSLFEDLIGLDKDSISIEEYSKRTGLNKNKINFRLRKIIKTMQENEW